MSRPWFYADVLIDDIITEFRFAVKEGTRCLWLEGLTSYAQMYQYQCVFKCNQFWRAGNSESVIRHIIDTTASFSDAAGFLISLNIPLPQNVKRELEQSCDSPRNQPNRGLFRALLYLFLAGTRSEAIDLRQRFAEQSLEAVCGNFFRAADHFHRQDIALSLARALIHQIELQLTATTDWLRLITFTNQVIAAGGVRPSDLPPVNLSAIANSPSATIEACNKVMDNLVFLGWMVRDLSLPTKWCPLERCLLVISSDPFAAMRKVVQQLDTAQQRQMFMRRCAEDCLFMKNVDLRSLIAFYDEQRCLADNLQFFSPIVTREVQSLPQLRDQASVQAKLESLVPHLEKNANHLLSAAILEATFARPVLSCVHAPASKVLFRLLPAAFEKVGDKLLPAITAWFSMLFAEAKDSSGMMDILLLTEGDGKTRISDGVVVQVSQAISPALKNYLQDHSVLELLKTVVAAPKSSRLSWRFKAQVIAALVERVQWTREEENKTLSAAVTELVASVPSQTSRDLPFPAEAAFEILNAISARLRAESKLSEQKWEEKLRWLVGAEAGAFVKLLISIFEQPAWSSSLKQDKRCKDSFDLLEDLKPALRAVCQNAQGAAELSVLTLQIIVSRPGAVDILRTAAKFFAFVLPPFDTMEGELRRIIATRRALVTFHRAFLAPMLELKAGDAGLVQVAAEVQALADDGKFESQILATLLVLPVWNKFANFEQPLNLCHELGKSIVFRRLFKEAWLECTTVQEEKVAEAVPEVDSTGESSRRIVPLDLTKVMTEVVIKAKTVWDTLVKAMQSTPIFGLVDQHFKFVAGEDVPDGARREAIKRELAAMNVPQQDTMAENIGSVLSLTAEHGLVRRLLPILSAVLASTGAWSKERDPIYQALAATQTEAKRWAELPLTQAPMDLQRLRQRLPVFSALQRQWLSLLSEHVRFIKFLNEKAYLKDDKHFLSLLEIIGSNPLNSIEGEKAASLEQVRNLIKRELLSRSLDSSAAVIKQLHQLKIERRQIDELITVCASIDTLDQVYSDLSAEANVRDLQFLTLAETSGSPMQRRQTLSARLHARACSCKCRTCDASRWMTSRKFVTACYSQISLTTRLNWPESRYTVLSAFTSFFTR